MEMQNLKAELLTRIAKLKSMEISNTQIAAAVGLDEPQLELVLASPAYKEKFSALQLEKYESHDMMNSGWDAIEEEAAGTVLAYLRERPDPEYALKAAAMANKAQRRGSHANVPIMGGVTAAAVINLNAVFVNKLQTMREQPAGRTFEAGGEGKRVDALDIKSVQDLMKSDVEEVKNMFANVGREQQLGSHLERQMETVGRGEHPNSRANLKYN
jgi:hypothetical protein